MNDLLKDALNGIDDQYIAEAAQPQKRARKPYWYATIAALLALAIGLGAIFGSNGIPGATTGPARLESKPTAVFPTTTSPFETNSPLFTLESPVSPDTLQLANLVAAPHYTAMPPYPFGEDQSGFGIEETEAYLIWREATSQWGKQYALTREETENLHDFLWRSTQEFLCGDGNQAYSPLNVYMSLAALAECTDGNSRQEILNLLGLDSIESLRNQAQKIWNAHYFSDGNTNCLLATSVWLDDSYSFNVETVQSLVDNYFASVFHGDLGSEEMNLQLRQWLNSQTGGLLTEQSKHSKLEENTVFALTSTLLFNARWLIPFSEKDNTLDTFHGTGGDYTTEFMHEELRTYYWGDNFGAVKLYLNHHAARSMWLILPDEGCTPQDVLQSDDWLKCVQNYAFRNNDCIFEESWKNQQSVKVNLSLPKFDVSSQNDLMNGMKKLGLHDVFDHTTSDFSPICADVPIYVNQIDHAVRIAIDEESVTAAAYTISAGGVGGFIENEIDFVLDRPFIFVITSWDGLPLFTGIVNEP